MSFGVVMRAQIRKVVLLLRFTLLVCSLLPPSSHPSMND